MYIAKDSIVSLRYIMKNSKGEILENSMDSDPVSYLHGSAGITASLQAQLEGLKAGDKRTICLRTETGLTSEDFIFEVRIDDVRAALEEEILLGYPVNLNVTKCGADCDCYTSQ